MRRRLSRTISSSAFRRSTPSSWLPTASTRFDRIGIAASPDKRPDPKRLARGLDPKNVHHLGQVFRSRPSPRQRGVIKEYNLARRSLDGLRRSLAGTCPPGEAGSYVAATQAILGPGRGGCDQSEGAAACPPDTGRTQVTHAWRFLDS